MWWSRRLVLTGAVALAGCGFQPVHAPGGSGARLRNQITLKAPDSRASYLFAQRFEERLGRGGGFDLEVGLKISESGLGGTSAGVTTRIRKTGQARYALRRPGQEAKLLEGWTEAFTSYSATGSTVATRAAARDAEARLMVILADQVISALLLDADGLAL